MSKKILFMSSAKLTAISIGLLLAVFCTIGMSFTPAEEGEILDPNDSTTVVSRPRRAHDPGTAGCGTEKTNDYGNAIAVSKGGGTVTIANVSGGGSIYAVYKGTTSSWGSSTGTTLPVTSNATANSGVKVVWVCGETDKTSGTAANHKHKFKWTATPSTGYKFDGWSTDGTNIDASITQSYDYEMEMDATQYNGGDGYSSSNPLAYTLYAHFSEKVLTTITMPATEHGSYTYSCADGSGTINTSTSGTVTTKEEITFTATPASGYKFFGWYTLSGTTENYLSFSNPYTKGFSANTTIYAKFIPSADAAYTLKGTSRYFTDLSSAISVASSSSNKVIVPVINGTVPAGNYTIPSGVTLLIPFDADYTLTTKPTDVQSWVNLSEYRRLKLANGTNITVNGTLCVAGRQFGTSSSNPGPGSVLGAYGVLDMSAGGHVAIASGANFYAYGFVIGNGNQSTSGTITIQNGGNVYEDLVINDLHGGGGTAACVNGTSATNSYELFPFNQYFVQNVEPKMTIEYGGSETVYFDIQSGQGGKQDAAKLIGNTTSHLFQLFSGASVTKWYDATRDYQCYSIEGAMTMNGISVNAVVTTLSSTSFILPVNNNMEITVKDGATLNLPYSIKFQTGANLIIEEDAVVNVGKDLYFYDYQDWDKFSCGYAQTFGLTSSGKKLSWHTLRTVSSASALGHANLVVNGTLNINSNNGALYTTSHGGNITSTGSGKIVFNVEAKSTNKNLYEIWSTYGKKSDGTALKQGETDYYTGQVLVGNYSYGKDYYIYGTPVACTPAQLHNADGSYTATAGSTAGTVFTYCCGTWLKQNGCGEPYYVTWKNGSTTIDTESFYACEDPVYTGATPTKDDDASYCHYTFNGWSATDGGDVLSMPLPRTTATYYAHFTSEPTVASVTIGGTTTYHATLADAFAKAKTGDNALITLLQDVSGVSTGLTYNPTSAYKCTLDLNDKKISGTTYTLLKIDKASATLTITDSGTKGEITTTFSNGGNSLRYCAYVSAGILKLEKGKISINNTTAYSSSVGCAAVGVATNANYKFIMEGGALEASGNYRAHGVYSYGTTEISGGTINATVSASNGAAYGVYSAANTTTVSGSPVITVNAYKNAYGGFAAGNTPNGTTGAFTNGTLKIEGGTFNVTTTTYDGAYGAYATAAPRVISSGDYAGTYFSYGTVNVSGGTFNVTAKRRSAYGVYVNRAYVQTKTRPNAVSSSCPAQAEISGGTFIVKTDETSGEYTAEGVRSLGTTIISGGSFTITANTYSAMGVNALDGTTTIENTHTPNFTVRANTYGAYGVYAGTTPATKTGIPYNGSAIVNGGTFDVALNNKASADNKNVYGVYAVSGKRTIKETDSGYDASSYYVGTYVSAGSITVNGGTFLVDGHTTIVGVGATSTSSYSATNLTYGDETIACPAISATASMIVNGGKFKVTGTSGVVACQKPSPTSILQINGGYYNINTNLSNQVVSPKKPLALRSTHALYPDGYRYTVGLGGTVTWKNGETTLLTEDYLQGETPSYTGTTPTKAEDESYTYTHNSWDPTIAVMANADQTYTATFNHTEKKYSVNVEAGAGGTASPASVSNIGCVTASGDITATPNTGYQFSNWTLPTGVTAAAGYTTNSNPIRINATASGKTITANFTAKTYTVTLDNQSATTAGAANVTATYNEAMPSIAANLPAKTGYAFGGYFSETNGGGTQYYNADGTSAHIWDVDAASPTLYAKWTSSVVETGPVLDIVDATNDGANGTLTLNATSWPNSAAGYYINEVLYTRSANRTIVINYTGKEPGESFVIDVKKSGAAESYSCHSYTIPRVITSNTPITENQAWPIFVKGATLTVGEDITTGKIYVGADAKLVINEGYTLTAEGIYLRTTPTAAAEMLNNGSIDAQLYYTRIIDSKANYYPFGLPLDCDIEDVAMSDGSARPKYGSGWLLRWYDESSRAANGGATNNMTSKEGDPANFPTKIVGGRGYEMFSASNYYREFYFPIDHSKLKSTVPVSYTEDGAAGEKHAGWNVLVSPWTWTHNQISKPENITICWLEGNTWGEQDNPDVIPPSKLFAYQASPGQSIVSFTGTNIAAARRRVTAAEEPTRIQWIRLDVKDVNGEGDQTSIYSHPTRYEQTYKTGIDVAKQALTSTHAILYSSHAYGDMAFAGVADAQLEQGVPLTVYSPSAQELTISLRENDWLNRMEYVWLIDVETGMQINLLNSDYTFDAAEGTTRGRFFIRGQFKAPNITTDIQNRAGIEEGARKVLIDQKIYIEVNGRLYDATGKIVSK